ncbi:MAG: ABC transporter ATP-binding protein [Gemmatimonadota bacterium]
MADIVTSGLRKIYPAPKQRRGLPGSGGPLGTIAPGARSASAQPGRDIVALNGLDLQVSDGEFFGLLGPNGAGKTTTIGILTTRVRPSGGEARVGGIDVMLDPVRVKQRIGVVPQRPNPDRSLTVRENMLFHAAYFGIPANVAQRRSSELLDMLGIGDRGEAKVNHLSGGQQQRLMIARALVHEPEILFLDEPTVGLDPQARLALWEILRSLHAEGRTIVMTTHYMDEADKLCERIGIVDQGKLLVCDTPNALKARAPGGTMIELTLDGPTAGLEPGTLRLPGVIKAESRGIELVVYAERAGEMIPGLIRLAEEAGRTVRDIRLTEPSLETLFVSLTGRKLD